MKAQVPLWMALAGCLGCLLLGSVRAQAPKPEPAPKPEAAPKTEAAPKPETPSLTEYPYLPNRYGEAFIPSVADWQALRLTALGASTTRITEEFNRQHLTCFVTSKGLILTLDLVPQPKWKHYSGGKFTAPLEKVKPDLRKAVDGTMKFVRNFFSEVRDKDVQIRVFLNSESVGTWEDGKLTLNAEKPDPPGKG